MAQQTINVGTVPNDGTGDTLRTAFTKTQNNFSEFYAAFTPVLASNNTSWANNLTSGNSTVNATANSTGLFFNGTFSQLLGTGYNVGNSISQFFVNSSLFWIGNSTVNVSTNSTHYFAGNSTFYAYGNSTTEVIANSTGQTVITPVSFSVGNSTANMTGNSTYETIANSTANVVMNPSTLAILSTAANLYIGNSSASFLVANTTGVTVASNTLTLGTSNVAGHTVSLANGYVTLPGGLKLMWGTLATVNTTAQITTFSTTVGAAFLTNAFSVFATSNNTATTVAVQSVNSTTITLISNNATAQTAYWAALGI